MPQRLAFLGLGVMGYPMAGHLARAGHRVTVYNRTAPKAERRVAQFRWRATHRPAAPIGATYARAVTLMGPVGAGQLTKMVNQICIAGLIEGLSEGLNFAQRAGLDPLRVLDVISTGAAQSWQMENRGKTMVADQF